MLRLGVGEQLGVVVAEGVGRDSFGASAAGAGVADGSAVAALAPVSATAPVATVDASRAAKLRLPHGISCLTGGFLPERAAGDGRD
ncbi:hypothetical protein [Micromonospora sp. AMSO31t]|uniref:hypothetical protein n=1 Tax=Micromonospora sp. AMSO31t TaxID=2650566 RepID=UPI00124BC38E|nr:hypothetical protein [Micromonospora sp. AMSO31t]KAB1904937.1 hypothetical protein F8274_27720 [Micromonospora sp. AMSO31t]